MNEWVQSVLMYLSRPLRGEYKPESNIHEVRTLIRCRVES